MSRFLSILILSTFVVSFSAEAENRVCSSLFQDQDSARREIVRDLVSKKPLGRQEALLDAYHFLTGTPFDPRALQQKKSIDIELKVLHGTVVRTTFYRGRKTESKVSNFGSRIIALTFATDPFAHDLLHEKRRSNFHFFIDNGNLLDINSLNNVNGERLVPPRDPDLMQLIDSARAGALAPMMDPADLFELHAYFDEFTIKIFSGRRMVIERASSINGETITHVTEFQFLKNESGHLERIEITEKDTPQHGDSYSHVQKTFVLAP